MDALRATHTGGNGDQEPFNLTPSTRLPLISTVDSFIEIDPAGLSTNTAPDHDDFDFGLSFPPATGIERRTFTQITIPADELFYGGRLRTVHVTSHYTPAITATIPFTPTSTSPPSHLGTEAAAGNALWKWADIPDHSWEYYHVSDQESVRYSWGRPRRSPQCRSSSNRSSSKLVMDRKLDPSQVWKATNGGKTELQLRDDDPLKIETKAQTPDFHPRKSRRNVMTGIRKWLAGFTAAELRPRVLQHDQLTEPRPWTWMNERIVTKSAKATTPGGGGGGGWMRRMAKPFLQLKWKGMVFIVEEKARAKNLAGGISKSDAGSAAGSWSERYGGKCKPLSCPPSFASSPIHWRTPTYHFSQCDDRDFGDCTIETAIAHCKRSMTTTVDRNASRSGQ